MSISRAKGLIRNHKETFVPFWYEFKNSVAVHTCLWARDEITVHHSLLRQNKLIYAAWAVEAPLAWLPISQ